MVNYLEIDTTDRLEVSITPTEIELYTDYVRVMDSYLIIGGNDKYVLTPFRSATSISYTIPESIVNGLATVSELEAAIRDKVGRQEVALISDIVYNTKTGYDFVTGGTLREQILASVSSSYISNGPTGHADILKVDFSQAIIGTVYDDQGNIVYENAHMSDISRDVVTTKNSSASAEDVITAIATWDASTVQRVQQLEAKTVDQEIQLTETKGIFIGASTIVSLWAHRNTNSNKVIGNLCLNPSDNKWYQYFGGALGPLNDGWVLYEGTVTSDTNKVKAKVYTQSTEPTNSKMYDVWVDTNRYSNIAGFTSRYKVLEHNGTGFVEISPDATKIGWAGGASSLLTGADGSITGWSYGNGSNSAGVFKINTNNFMISNGVNSHTPFSIIENGQGGYTSKFNGLVTFTGLGIDTSSTSINGSKIRSGELASTVTTTNGANPISKYDLDNGVIEIRDANNIVRVRLGKFL